MAWRAKLADPDWCHVVLDEVCPVLPHGLDKGWVRPLGEAAVHGSPPGPRVYVGAVDKTIGHVELDGAVSCAGEIVSGLGTADNDEPIWVHLEQAVAGELSSSGPAVPGHGAPDAADLVAEISANDARIVDKAGHDGLPVLDPVFLGLRDAAQRAEMVIGPAGVAGVGATAPGGVGDVVVDDDGDAFVSEGLDASLEDVEGAQAHQVRIGGKEVREDMGILDDELVSVG